MTDRERGRYPSHEAELKATRYPWRLYDLAKAQRRPAFGYGSAPVSADLPSGLICRRSLHPEVAPDSILLRVLAPAGGWMSADLLAGLAEAAEQYGEGLVHFSVGGPIEIYVPAENVSALLAAVHSLGLDIGSSGDGLRAVTSCCGPARCDAAVVDAPAIATYLGRRFVDEQQYPGFPHKVKTAVAGCRNDCIRATMQKDHCFVGVYRDPPAVDQERLREWLEAGGDLDGLRAACPEGAIRGDAGAVSVDPARCRRCMVCINRCPAFRPGGDRGVAWVAGGKYGARGRGGATPGRVLVPFIPVTGDDYSALGDFYGRFLEVWSEHALGKERVGDFIARLGPGRILREMGVAPEGGD